MSKNPRGVLHFPRENFTEQHPWMGIDRYYTAQNNMVFDVTKITVY